MKKNILFLMLLFISVVINSQITNEPPKSISTKLNKKIPVVTMPSFDLKKVQQEDEINDQIRTKPYRFGYEFKVDLGPKNSGVWEKLPNGDEIWRLTVKSEGANTLNFVFDSYKLAEGATVHIYNQNKSFVLGAYTSKMNNEYNSLGTWTADGDEITVEYYVPSKVKGQGKFHIGSVVHGYRSVGDYEAHQKGLNESGNCNQDVSCSVGSDFDGLKDKLKKSVAFILANGTDWCSGTLINNTSNNKAPYLLTAFHCGDLEAIWAFRFNWISTNSVCANVQNSTDNGPSNYYQTTSGSVNLAKNAFSDFRLIQITGGLDESWDLEWAGWDRSDNIPSYTVGIHHPSGDIMKVCRDNQSPTKTASTIDGQTSQVWRVADWDLGVTEGGSSGSALFDPNGRIIGQLFGGAAACSGTNDNNAQDVYGRFNISWNTGVTNDTRLSNWLDPNNTGQVTLNMLSEENALSIPDNKLKEETIIFPNPTTGIVNVSNKSSNKLTYTVYDISGKKVDEGSISTNDQTLNISGKRNGIYFMSISDLDANARFTQKIILDK